MPDYEWVTNPTPQATPAGSTSTVTFSGSVAGPEPKPKPKPKRKPKAKKGPHTGSHTTSGADVTSSSHPPMRKADKTMTFHYQNHSGERVYFYGDGPECELSISADLWGRLGVVDTLEVGFAKGKGAKPVPNITLPVAQEITG